MAQRGACVQGERPPAPTLSVGAGLLTKAAGQLASMLNVPPRATAPHPTWGAHKYSIQPNSPVGAGLLAKAAGQLASVLNVSPEQAPNIQPGMLTNTASNPTPMWERACSRKRRVSLHQC